MAYDIIYDMGSNNSKPLFAKVSQNDSVKKDEKISFREAYFIDTEPYRLSVRGYNDDETNDHSPIIRIGILPPQVVAPWLSTYEERIRAALGG